jgi:hypothetical protein
MSSASSQRRPQPGGEARGTADRAADHALPGEPDTLARLDPRSEAFDRAFDRAFGLIAFAMNRHLIEHMLRAQRELDVDFESLVLWGLLAHLNVAHLLPPGGDPALILDSNGRVNAPDSRLRALRLRDIEQIARMPRETVRRKLVALEERGYVERTAQGWVCRRDAVDARLIEFNRETARRLLLTAGEVTRLLHQGAAALPTGDAGPR